MDDNAFSLEDRLLCSDGACIGLVGPDGRCKACGKVYEGDESLPETDMNVQPSFGTDPLPVSGDESVAPLLNPEADDHPESDPLEPTDRIPCPDDMCVGIIGPDGRCGTCDRSQ